MMIKKIILLPQVLQFHQKRFLLYNLQQFLIRPRESHHENQLDQHRLQLSRIRLFHHLGINQLLHDQKYRLPHFLHL